MVCFVVNGVEPLGFTVMVLHLVWQQKLSWYYEYL